jgi:hypothetical protein
MSYEREKILEQAKKLIIEKELIFIEEVASFLPISKKTFYAWFPIDSNESNEIKAMLDFNKVDAKAFMRKKWKEAEAPALQIALYKLCGTDDENHKLNGSKQEVKQETKVEGAILNW